MSSAQSSPVSLSAIAARVGIHVTSVSRALRGSPKVSPAVAEKVRKVAAEMGYIPDRAARAMRGVSTRSIGAVVPNVISPVIASFVDILYAECREAGYDLEIHFHEWCNKREEEAIRTLISHRVDGIFLDAASARSLKDLAPYFSTPAAPRLVAHTLERAASSSRGRFCQQVYSDLPRGYHHAFEHLYAAGHRRISVLIPGPFGRYTHGTLSRKLALEVGGHFPGLVVNPFCITKRADLLTRVEVGKHGRTAREGIVLSKEFAEDYFRQGFDATAVVTSNDIHALAVVEAATRRGINIPHDLSLITFGGSFLCELGHLHLSHVQYPTFEAGRRVIQLLLDQGEKQSDSGIEYLPTQFFARDSVASPQIEVAQ